MIALFLAKGFEEAEALIPLDMLRRVGVEVVTVGVGGKVIEGAHAIPVTADIPDCELDVAKLDGVILPGGMPGTKNLMASEIVSAAIDACAAKGQLLAAICAAPSVLGQKGLLQNKNATCFPGFEDQCVGANVLPQGVVVDGNIITAKGAGCAFPFGAAIVSFVKDQTTAQQLLQDMQYNERHS